METVFARGRKYPPKQRKLGRATHTIIRFHQDECAWMGHLPHTEIISGNGKQLKVSCLWREDTNPSLIFTLTMQQWFCFPCKSLGKEYHGSLRRFVERVRDCPTTDAQEFMARLAVQN